MSFREVFTVKNISFKTLVYSSLGMFGASLLTLTLAAAQSQNTTQTKIVAPSASATVPTARDAHSGMATGRRELLPEAPGVAPANAPGGDAAEAKKHVANIKWSARQAPAQSSLDGASQDAAKSKVSTLDGASKEAAKSAVKPQDIKTGQSSGK